ncbi:MAG: PAS domain S-box protein [Hadesarchaea archaeon]|nr:PAS domain S-box protein [Hadesarchaea archaeon]
MMKEKSKEEIKVLFVDDESEVLEQAEIFLKKEKPNLNIETISSAELGLKKLEEDGFDAVVSDYKMPEMSGLEFLQKLRKNGNDIPFIILTGKGREEVAMDALNIGADRYLQKGKDPKSQYVVLADAIVQEVKHQRSKERLKESEKRFQSFFEELGDAVFVTAVNGKNDGEILEVNSTTIEQTGYSRNELIGMNITDDLSVGEPEEISYEEISKKLLNGESVTFTVKGKRKDESTYWEEVKVVPIRYKGMNAGLSISRDITSRKEMEEELEYLAKEWEETFNALDDMVFILNKDHELEKANQEFLEVTGVSKEEIQGKKCYELIHDLGAPIKKCPLEESLESKDSEENEFYEPSLDRYLLAKVQPITDEEGNVRKVVHQLHDITQRKEMMKKEGFLHSILRHDLRNKTNIVRGYLELLRDTDLSEKQEEFLGKADKATREGIELIEKVRSIRKIGEEAFGEVKLNTILKNVIKETKTQASEKGIEIELTSCDYKVWGGPLLNELFSNLVENSILHSGCEKIKISCREEDEEVIVSIEDDGRGVPDEDKGKVFKRDYKRGKSAVSGLGLYLVKGVAKSYDGDVKIRDSELGGARFDIYLKKT